MTKGRSRLIVWIAIEIAFLFGICISSIYDFEITYFLSGANIVDGRIFLNVSLISKIIEFISEFPPLIFFAFTSIILVRNLLKIFLGTKKAVFLGLIYLLAPVCMFRAWSSAVENVVGDGNLTVFQYVLSAIIAVISTVIIHFIVWKLPKKLLKMFFAPAAVTAISVITALIVQTSIKIIWGRMRMTDIVAANDITLFTSWFVPNWFSGGHSLPSGHTMTTTQLLLVPIWLERLQSPRGRKTTYAVIGAYIALVAFSRLCVAAHFLSDVIFGFVISFIITQIATIKYEKTFKNKPIPSIIRTSEMTLGGTERLFESTMKFSPTAQGLSDVPEPKPENKAPVDPNFSPREISKDYTAPEAETASVKKTPSAPAKETVPLTPIRPTSFSLDKIRAEKAEMEAAEAQRLEEGARRLDEQLRYAVTDNIAKYKDYSVPVIPKSQPKSTEPKKKKSSQSSKSKTKAKTGARKHDDGSVQMHFKFDDQSSNLTSDLSDE